MSFGVAKLPGPLPAGGRHYVAPPSRPRDSTRLARGHTEEAPHIRAAKEDQALYKQRHAPQPAMRR